MEQRREEEKCYVKRGLWKSEEDMILRSYVEAHGEGGWADISRKSGLKRGGKSCRLRWKNYLRPNIKRGSMSPQEQDLIIRMHKLLGNRWSLIAGRLPGRTDNEVKNYWNTHLNKKSNPRKQNAPESIGATPFTWMEETNPFGYNVRIGTPLPLISHYPDNTLVFDPCFGFTDFYPLL